MTETVTQDPDLFLFDGLLYLQNEDYQDWVDLEIARRDYERYGLEGCMRVS